MTISDFILTDCAHTLYQILVSLQIVALGGATAGFGYQPITYGYGYYGNTATFQHV
jgi:hypothetical protein